MIRSAMRPLAGPWRGEPEIKTGRYNDNDYDGVQYTHRPNPDTPTGYPWLRELVADVRKLPAVSVRISSGRAGVRTYVHPEEMRAFAAELLTAAAWLELAQAEESA